MIIFTIEQIDCAMIFSDAIVMYMYIALIPANTMLFLIENDGNSIDAGVVVFRALYIFGYAYSWGPGTCSI